MKLPAAELDPTPARTVRLARGLSLAAAAAALRITPGYLRRQERRVGWSILLAQRAARLYRVPVDVFVYRMTRDRLTSIVTGGASRPGEAEEPRGSRTPGAGGELSAHSGAA